MQQKMQEWKQNGTVKAVQQLSFLVVLIATIIGGVVYVTARLARLETKVEHLSVQIVAVNKFMMRGERFTAEDGRRLQTDIERIEKEIRTYPPQWFRNNFSDLRSEVKELKALVAVLNSSISILGQKQETLLEGKEGQ